MTLATPTGADTQVLVDRLLAMVPSLSASINADVRHQKLSVPLTMGQFRTLYHLASGYSTPAALAEHLTVTRPTITRLIDGLERKGLVERGSVDNDRRQVRLELTVAGRAVLKEFQARARKRMRGVVEQLEPFERDELGRALTALDRAMVRASLGRISERER